MTTRSRRQFLRQLGATALAGVGIALVPGSSQAKALAAVCCPDSSCPSCNPPQKKYRCQGCGCNYCACINQSGCFQSGCC